MSKSGEVPDAIKKSLAAARKQMYSVPLLKGTITHDVEGVFGSTKVVLKPAPAVMACTAGVMSLFSSGLGVVFSTLLPTVAELGQSIGVNPVELASMVLIGGTITGLSPISTTGGLIMATLMADESGTAKKDEEMKLFMELTGWALGILVVLTLLAGVGFYNLIF